MDLRAPLPDEDDHVDDRDSTTAAPSKQCDDEGRMAPCVVQSGLPSSATLEYESYEKILFHLLCRMYIASQANEMGSESRFTGLVLFHRYARRFYCLVAQQKKEQQSLSQELQQLAAVKEQNQIKKHLGPVAAACLFLGCKMEEDTRRIRDVINLSHLLNFSSWDDNAIAPSLTSHEQTDLKALECNGAPITIVESLHPPPLDDSYWNAKEQMVSTEQHVLRMIRFDTIVCHPHRCVLMIMETLGFGIGRNDCNGSKNDKHHEKNWLLNCDQSESVILRAWRILNETPLDPRGLALKFPVIVLSCASISLAAEGEIENDDETDKYGKMVPLPDFWWRALDVRTNDITRAREALQKVLRIENKLLS